MKLILLYGAPGTGKLTVATRLSKKTGYTLFHNHMILNVLCELYGYDNAIRRKLEKEFRLRIIEESAKTDMNMIATGVIMRDNEEFYKKIWQTVLDNNGECLVVYLTATKDILIKRIGEESRKNLKKISTVERLNEWHEQYPESFEKLDFPNQYSVDTSNLSPDQVVRDIMSHYNLG
ncbi:AAA family ATPase [Candidatus Roizmanbacteria bacterium]|nr:AAA family ATPase [Candidatus Roizmanbacteria bacterium]